jgi:beta-glucanase (GH16 family)
MKKRYAIAGILFSLLVSYYPAEAASPDGTTMPSATQIEDSVGNIWIPGNGIFYVNGNPVTGPITTMLLYYTNTIYASNSDGNWYAWNNSSGWYGVQGDPRGKTTCSANLDLKGYTLTFNDEFKSQTVSDSLVYNGAKWYTHNEQCCMSTTDGATTAMVGLSDQPSPFSLIPGGGLRIRLQRIGNRWTSGVLTSVDNSGNGFSQQYGYFEMEAQFPSGYDTWPAFWMLNTAAKASGAPAGEIDIVEYIANPGFIDYIRSTIHDWSNGSVPAWSANQVKPIPSDGNFHTYAMLWTPQTVTFYYDRQVMLLAATPPIMHQPYYLIVDLGIGAGWPTEATPYVNDMVVKHIRAYSPK